jgi:PqqD family protein of HPr-rel-A system
MGSRKLSRGGAVVWCRVDDAMALYDTRVGIVHILNETAASIWALCDGTRTANAIALELLQRFEVSRGVLSADVRSILKEFRALRLLE